MFDRDKWQEIFATMGKNKLRTILTALSVMWGIFILIVLLASGNGLRNGAESQFKSDAINSIWIDAGQTSLAFKGMKVGRTIQLTNEDVQAIQQKIKNIDKLSSVYNGRMNRMMKYKNETGGFTVRSCMPDHNYLERAKMVEGRWINKIDFDECRKVCVIGIPVKEALFKTESPIGKYINVEGISFKVVGLFTDPGRGDNERIYIPLTTSQKAYNGKNNVNVIWLSTLNPDVNISYQMADEIKQLLAERHIFNPADPAAVGVRNNTEEYEKIMSVLTGIKLFVWVIGIFTLIAGVVGVSNIMMIVVKERTKEIGIRKAIGATPGSIISLVILESVVVTFLAGSLGLLLGIGVVFGAQQIGIDSEYFKNPEIDMSVAISSVFTIVIAGAIAGFFPALRASAIQPVVALRDL
jgi:putative ABC transport system permease protein